MTASLQQMRQGDEWQKPRIPLYYRDRAAQFPPPPATPEYIEAYRKAEEWLSQNTENNIVPVETLLRMESAGAA